MRSKQHNLVCIQVIAVSIVYRLRFEVHYRSVDLPRRFASFHYYFFSFVACCCGRHFAGKMKPYKGTKYLTVDHRYADGWAYNPTTRRWIKVACQEKKAAIEALPGLMVRR